MIIEKKFPLQFHQKEKRKCRFFLANFKNIKNFELNWHTSIIWIIYVLHIGSCFHNSLMAEKFIRFVFTIINDIADNIFCFEAASIWAAKISWSFNCNMKIASEIGAGTISQKMYKCLPPSPVWKDNRQPPQSATENFPLLVWLWGHQLLTSELTQDKYTGIEMSPPKPFYTLYYWKS